MTVQEAFALALRHHQGGRLAEAEVLYRQILAAQPDCADAWHLLGVIAHRHGRLDLGVEWIRRALALDSTNPVAHYNLANALKDQGRLEDAILEFRQALALNPDSPEAQNNLGNTLHQLGRFDEAILHCRRAVDLRPDFVQAHYNLGNALKDLHRFPEAVAAYRRSLELDRQFVQGYNNLGIALAGQKDYQTAIASFEEAIRLDPHSARTHNNLGKAFVELRRLDEAVAAYRRALALQPDYADAHVNLGLALREQGCLDEAVAHHRQAITLRPDFAEAYNNLGNTLTVQGDLDNALAAYRESLRLQPDSPKVHSNIILALHSHPAQDAAAIRAEHERWNARFCAPFRGSRPRLDPDRRPERRLRLGYVSPDFRDHVVGRNLLPLFRHHHHDQFEIFCYSDAPRSDQITAEYRQLSDTWRDIMGVADTAVARLVREDRIDILVDLAQHTGGNRLPVFAHQPAPVQVSFAGYPDSAGLETIRYRLSDRWLENTAENASLPSSRCATGPPPPASCPLDPASGLYLLDSFWCYDPCGVTLDVTELPAATQGFVTFGCLNSFCKINEPTLRMWARVLAQVPDSRLHVLSAAGSHRQRMLDDLARQGIPPERIEFVLPRSRQPYLELYHQLDVFLDTFPYNGHTTSLDALWMGVPVVSLAGEVRVSRGCWSILNNLGLPELVGHSADDYVRIAADLARDRARLTHLRSTLRTRLENSLLMDATHFTAQIESAFRAIWRHSCAHEV
jgi:predicted O-linked N-acetylglucosamine transferase (SPINDLY family)